MRPRAGELAAPGRRPGISAGIVAPESRPQQPRVAPDRPVFVVNPQYEKSIRIRTPDGIGDELRLTIPHCCGDVSVQIATRERTQLHHHNGRHRIRESPRQFRESLTPSREFRDLFGSYLNGCDLPDRFALGGEERSRGRLRALPSRRAAVPIRIDDKQCQLSTDKASPIPQRRSAPMPC
jgi:hypothetical protein